MPNWWERATPRRPKGPAVAKGERKGEKKGEGLLRRSKGKRDRGDPERKTRMPDESRFSCCPACNRQVHVHSLNHHLDLECEGSAAGTTEAPVGFGADANLASVDCPLCGRRVALGVINAHLDSGCDHDDLSPTAKKRSKMSDVLERMRDDLICCICLDIFDDPASLPCGHQYCRACITDAFEQTVHECPQCKEACRKKSIKPSAITRSLVAKWRLVLWTNVSPRRRFRGLRRVGGFRVRLASSRER